MTNRRLKIKYLSFTIVTVPNYSTKLEAHQPNTSRDSTKTLTKRKQAHKILLPSPCPAMKLYESCERPPKNRLLPMMARIWTWRIMVCFYRSLIISLRMIKHRKRRLTWVKNLRRKVSRKSKARGFKRNSQSKFLRHSDHWCPMRKKRMRLCRKNRVRRHRRVPKRKASTR